MSISNFPMLSWSHSDFKSTVLPVKGWHIHTSSQVADISIVKRQPMFLISTGSNKSWLTSSNQDRKLVCGWKSARTRQENRTVPLIVAVHDGCLIKTKTELVSPNNPFASRLLYILKLSQWTMKMLRLCLCLNKWRNIYTTLQSKRQHCLISELLINASHPQSSFSIFFLILKNKTNDDVSVPCMNVTTSSLSSSSLTHSS